MLGKCNQPDKVGPVLWKSEQLCCACPGCQVCVNVHLCSNVSNETCVLLQRGQTMPILVLNSTLVLGLSRLTSRGTNSSLLSVISSLLQYLQYVSHFSTLADVYCLRPVSLLVCHHVLVVIL